MRRQPRHIEWKVRAWFHSVPVWREYPTDDLVQAILQGGGQEPCRELQRRFMRLTFSFLRRSGCADLEQVYVEVFKQALFSSGEARYFSVRLHDQMKSRIGNSPFLPVTFFRRHFLYAAGYGHARYLEAFDDAWQPGMSEDQVLDAVSEGLRLGKQACAKGVARAGTAVRKALVRRGADAISDQTGGRMNLDDLFPERKET